MKLVPGKLMAQIDKYTINEIGIPGAVLMENAGKGAFLHFLEDYSPEKDDKFLIVCGKGNNGGDGFVIARYLVNNGFKNVKIVLLTEAKNLKGDALINYNVAKNFNIDIIEVTDANEFNKFLKNNTFNYVFDGILGTGLNSEIKDFYKIIIEAINDYNAIKIAIDIPSGLCSERGIPLGTCIKANTTYTFGLKKIGLSTYPGVLYCGDVKLIDISIPQNLPFEINDFEIDIEIVKNIYKPRPIDGHKGRFGHALILGGSIGFSGAVILASKACLRCGSGLVTAIIPQEINEIFEASLPEAMSHPFNIKRFYDLEDLLKFINSKSAILIGPGLGTSNDATNFLYELLEKLEIPVILDADALNIIANEDLNILNKINIPKIITPHPGEFSRLSKLSKQDIQNNRLETAKNFAKEYNCVVVLKGFRTVITDGEKSYICPKGNDALSKGGSGDVLGGMILSFLAQKYNSIESSILGVYLHGLTGEICSEKFCSDTVIANDLIENLHYSFKIIKSGNDS